MENDTMEVPMTIDVIREAMGNDASEFITAMELVQQMIENPENFFGAKAAIEATRLAALRTKISMKAQFYKTKKTGDALETRRRKDVLMALYSSLEENINCLKLMARSDLQAAGIMR